MKTLIETPVTSLTVAIMFQSCIKRGLNTTSIPHIRFNKVNAVPKSFEINVDKNKRVTNVIAIEIGFGIIIFKLSHHLLIHTKMPFNTPNAK